jgi:hypothetical protein
MVTVISLLLASTALVVLWFAGTGLRRAPQPVRVPVPAAHLRAPGSAVARAEGAPGIGRHDDRRCPR